jgi:chromosome segregation protein
MARKTAKSPLLLSFQHLTGAYGRKRFHTLTSLVMRLTKLELKGFKSFADKTVINFENDITGIVGPNGCGKSNIVDAIRWVLGEQRAKTLRLEKMDNIIFNGTKDRKAGNLAEVSLTFDNTKNIIPTEFSAVTITRTLYRTGESEYKINGITCRLKDIRDMFLDTGIGSNTYAIMELKMIDDILSDVDNSRRSLIEQAAGISKYKQRKKETVSKLNSTEADLNRVEDLLFEIENNLKSLEAQARKALRYKKLQEDYKVLSIDLARYDIITINEQYEALQKAMEEFTDGRSGLEAEIRKREAALQALKTDILDREKSLSEEQKELNAFINSIQERESDKRVSGQKLEFLKERIGVLESQLVSLGSEEKLLKKEIDDLNDKVFKEEATIKTFKDEVEKAKAALEEKRTANLELKEKLDDQLQQQSDVRNQLNESEKMLAVRESRMESMKNSIQRSLFEKEERLEEVKLLEVAIADASAAVNKQASLIEDLEKKEEKNITEIEKLETGIEKNRNSLLESRRDLDAKSNEYRLTRNMVDSLEGFPESIKFLKAEAGWLKDTPLLSDILYCEEQYRIALELALKPYLNHFIVATEADARKAIDLLSGSAKGRANFFILEQFRSLKIPPSKFKPGKSDGVVIHAPSIVEADKEVRNLLEFLLKDVYLVESAEKVILKSDDVLLVEMSGAWIKSRVEISGGTVGLFEGKRLGRLKNLERLEKAIGKLKLKAAADEKKLKASQEKLLHLKNNSYRRTIDRERVALQQLERDLLTNQSRMENYKEFVDNQSRHHEEVEGSINAIKGEIDIIRTQFDKAEEASSIQQHKVEALENDFKAASLEFSLLQEQYNEKNILYIQNENALNSYVQSRSYKESRLEQVGLDMNRSTDELAFSVTEIENINKSLATLETDLIDLYSKRDEMKEALSLREGDYYELKETVQGEEDAIRKVSKSKEETDWNIQQNKEKRNTLKFELQSLRQRLSLEFKVDVESLLDELQKPDIDRTELEMKLERVTRRIDNFGEVNPMAEAAYEEMKKRFDFITEQKDDLIEAKETLLATIEEIENTARHQFLDSFSSIRDNFRQVFRSMFSDEDNCDLILADPDNPLDSKVEILAKPKGKRPQSINQLSGGEKSLTSLSLLFALYLYKPAPFCILDEVDAPLDDANVSKFNKAIREFAADSQFIVVTHNKSTMSAVDVSYGVTMHKAGQSMLVPADFRDHKDVNAETAVAAS